MWTNPCQCRCQTDSVKSELIIISRPKAQSIKNLKQEQVDSESGSNTVALVPKSIQIRAQYNLRARASCENGQQKQALIKQGSQRGDLDTGEENQLNLNSMSTILNIRKDESLLQGFLSSGNLVYQNIIDEVQPFEGRVLKTKAEDNYQKKQQNSQIDCKFQALTTQVDHHYQITERKTMKKVSTSMKSKVRRQTSKNKENCVGFTDEMLTTKRKKTQQRHQHSYSNCNDENQSNLNIEVDSSITADNQMTLLGIEELKRQLRGLKLQEQQLMKTKGQIEEIMSSQVMKSELTKNSLRKKCGERKKQITDLKQLILQCKAGRV